MFHIYRWIPAPFALPGMWEDYKGSSGLYFIGLAPLDFSFFSSSFKCCTKLYEINMHFRLKLSRSFRAGTALCCATGTDSPAVVRKLFAILFCDSFRTRRLLRRLQCGRTLTARITAAVERSLK